MSKKFFGVYREAADVRAGKEPRLSSVAYCSCCRQSISHPLYCSACQGVRYCGKSCQKRAWKGQGGYDRRPHKIECTEVKAFMAEMADMLAILKQFPWGIVNKDGQFNYELALALRSLLGEGPEFGWWRVSLPDAGLNLSNFNPDALFHDTYGNALLSEKYIGEKSGWKLPAEEIPWLMFDNGRKAPPFPPAFEHNWASYYLWRGLPLKSPVALLLHWPLSVYRLLSLLGLVPSESSASERHKLNIHLIGVGPELNCLPMYALYRPPPFIINLPDHSFGELALLFPNTDVDLVMFGSSAYNLTRQAKPSAIAAQKYVYEFRAPEQCGSGSIRIQIYKECAIWDPIDILSRKMIPDALIGLNAGMSTFDAWHPLFSTSRALSIPFAITEFGRISLVDDRLQYETFVDEARADIRLSRLLGHEKMQVLVKSLDQQPSIAMNPFMRPGNQACITHRMPAGTNAFSCIVTPSCPQTK